MEQDNEREIILLDEGGEPARFEHILTFLYEKERYIALEPVEESSRESDEAEVVLLRVEQVDGEDTYVSIDSEVMENEVFEHFLELMDEIEEEEQV
ncbi:MAG: DUF1292 domain-containing protein [Christensenellaceae bacterium]|jgi:uncharacterized protein YrzB (UPF0473 family)|nr:DUF1292 domain-containing protein [Christensenellaceae bacterium]